MATLTTRNELIDVNDIVQLVVVFTNQSGVPTNTDILPSVTLVQPSGAIAVGPTTAGVSQLNVGTYQYDWQIPYDGPYGVWVDVWSATINGSLIQNSLQFIVVQTDVPRTINSDGYVALGDDPGFDYTQNAIRNINKLMKGLKARLNNDGKAKSTDPYGNVTYVDCSIFSVEMLTTFLSQSLTIFNETPYFTFFTFEDTQALNQFYNVIVDGATLIALASQALIERGREFSIVDNGVNFNPPTVSELLNTQYTTLLTQHTEHLKYIKNSLRPAPKGLGTFRGLASNPSFMRLRHLRQRQLI
jgi:hypothetical protein